MKVRDIMSSNIESCSSQDSLQTVASKMKQLNIGALPVVENGQVTGMITDRDVTIRAVADDNANKNVEQVMTHNVVSVSPDASVEEAAQLMAQHQIRRLPVVENGQIVGMVALGDLSVSEKSNEKAGEALTQISQQNLQ
ncbi:MULTISPECIES: CBS domain-containing protein [Bacillus]|uniref:CBS domain-containing protein n=1 Tax=Bacillus TaxID=1386 RepID=UPI00065E2B40|nr:CBS domain-containing protein [Bacillus smithii]AKP47611.1 CBS domain protein [Bacillus smithii]MED0658527.1 CBS domain-containing protein [Bacillus smithii]MED1420157.1 CBS domain-containing protein [Bacillus smithii]MED1455657.1 CBS domain-containing protein [Bacillus smithii]MED1487822.1 CBS domain-containing protein [Bacillus smithii]